MLFPILFSKLPKYVEFSISLLLTMDILNEKALFWWITLFNEKYNWIGCFLLLLFSFLAFISL